MRFTIHDVEHGFCAHLQHDNGNVMLWDCGHKSQPEYRPSAFLPLLGVKQIDRFFVTNFDEDHISDLPNLIRSIPIRMFHRNISITPQQLRMLKLQGGPLSSAMQSLLVMLEEYNDFSVATALSAPPFPNVCFSTYCCSYPDFTDTNNLSVVTFLNINGTGIVIPGDVEKEAWEKLLENPAVTNHLQDIDIFIASHHGRENGYCRRVFDYCSPKLVVFSDSQIQYSTQEMTNAYASHASGMLIDDRLRKVVTTRNDSNIWFER